jgi:hypothetical protein
MAEQQPAALEMRIAELEDKLRQLTVSEDEMRTYQKVAAMLGRAAPTGAVAAGAMPAAGAGPTISPISPVIHQCIINQCIVTHCIINQCIIQTCWPPPIITQCVCQCACNPVAASALSGMGGPGAGFGSFGR